MVTRFGVSINSAMLKNFDEKIRKKGYSNRSEAIEDLIGHFVSHKEGSEITGIIRIISDPRVKSYQNKLSQLENEYHCLISGSSKKFIDHHNCLEVLIVKGTKERLMHLIALLKKEKSVRQAKFEAI